MIVSGNTGIYVLIKKINRHTFNIKPPRLNDFLTDGNDMTLINKLRKGRAIEYVHNDDDIDISTSNEKLALFCTQHQLAYQDALARFGGNESLYYNAMKLFTQDLSLYIKQTMTPTLIPAEISLMLHTLKSSAATFGFTELALYAKYHDTKLTHYTPVEFNQFIETLLDKLMTNQLLTTTFSEMIETNLQVTHEQDLIPTLAVNDEFMMLYATLMEEVSHYNMNAMKTFMKVAKTLKIIAPQHIELLTKSITELKFKQAEHILAEMHPFLMKTQRECK